ncbi:MAG: transferase, partial [Anaerolineae bacterium]|nr:transferase [Anaerolineae bacterium]
MHVLIVGAGGHGQVVADILFHMDALTPIAFVDDNSELHGRRFLGCPVVGHVAERTRVAYDG